MLAAVIPLIARFRHRLARPTTGLRALLCLLVLGFLLTGLPAGDLHAHVEGDHGHTHGVAPYGEELPPAPSDDGPATLHYHDATSVTQALPDAIAPLLVSLPPTSRAVLVAAPGPRLAPRPPPHRPPIA